MSNCYNAGEIRNASFSDASTIYIGGISGDVSLKSEESYYIKNCYNYGKLISNELNGDIPIYKGNITGRYSLGIINNCYYIKSDIKGIGFDEKEEVEKEIKEVTTEEMKAQKMVEDLNNNTTVWYLNKQNINNGYPILEYQYVEVNQEPEKEPVGELDKPENNNSENKESNKDNINTNLPEDNNIVNEGNIDNQNKDTTISDKILPAAGLNKYIVAIAIGIFLLVSIIYIKYSKLKDIK